MESDLRSASVVAPTAVFGLMKQLQEENQQLKRLVADRTLDKTMLQDVLAKKF